MYRRLILATASALALAMAAAPAVAQGHQAAGTAGVGAAAVWPAEARSPVDRPVLTQLGDAGAHRYTAKDRAVVRWSMPDDPRVERFDLIVNGVVQREVPRVQRGTYVTLRSGWNEVVVAAQTAEGATYSGTGRIQLDDKGPVFVHPTRIELRDARVTTSRVPLQLRWKGADENGLATGFLRDGSRYNAIYPLASQASRGPFPFTRAPGQHTVSAELNDRPGNRTTLTWTRKVEVRGESLGAHSAGDWARVASSSRYLHGSAYRTTEVGAELTFTTTARSIGWIAHTGPKGFGKVTIYVDGKLDTSRSLQQPSTGSHVVWSKNWPYPGERTVRVVVTSADPGRPVLSDGFAIIR